MFKPIRARADAVLTFTFEGRTIPAAPGASIASALLAADEMTFRSTPVSGEDRGPYCMMGICFECLVAVDGVPNRQACMIAVEDGMAVRRMGREDGAAA